MKHHNKGFTLLELLVTLVIIAIVATMGIPSFQGAISRSRLTTSINELSTAMNLARSEAIKHNRSVTIRKYDNLNWESGWRIFIDVNSNGTLTGVLDNGGPNDCAAGNDCILKVHEALPSTLTLRPSGINFTNFVRYTPMGVSSSAVGGSFYLCDSGSLKNSKVLILNGVGRPSMAVDSNNDGIPEIVTGTNIITCIP